MNAFLFWVLIAAGIVGGTTIDKRLEDGLPILPQLGGFKPTGILPGAPTTEEVYQDDQLTDYESVEQQPFVYDPHADTQVSAWMDEYIQQQVPTATPAHTATYAPETLENQSNQRSDWTRINNENSTFQRSEFDRTGVELVESSNSSLPFNSIEPESEGEFTYYEDLVAQGMAPKGNDILVEIWGVKPGNSEAYRQARKRRNEFADRLA